MYLKKNMNRRKKLVEQLTQIFLENFIAKNKKEFLTEDSFPEIVYTAFFGQSREGKKAQRLLQSARLNTLNVNQPIGKKTIEFYGVMDPMDVPYDIPRALLVRTNVVKFLRHHISTSHNFSSQGALIPIPRGARLEGSSFYKKVYTFNFKKNNPTYIGEMYIWDIENSQWIAIFNSGEQNIDTQKLANLGPRKLKDFFVGDFKANVDMVPIEDATPYWQGDDGDNIRNMIETLDF